MAVDGVVVAGELASKRSVHELSEAEKRAKIAGNYETIEVLRGKLDEVKSKQRSGMTRAAYIKMIFDATKKVNKQNHELDKIIVETRQLQREISGLTGRLQRSFAYIESAVLKVSCMCVLVTRVDVAVTHAHAHTFTM